MMEFGLREWLFILGPVFIVGVLAHGYWRMFRNRHNLKMALDKTYLSKNGQGEGESDEMSQFRAELPNGGARVRTIPEQTSLDLSQDVPVLMDPIEKPIVATRNDKLDLSSEISASKENSSLKESAPSKEIGEELPEKFIVIYVVALAEPFKGQYLLECLVDQGMTFGEMDIFHSLDIHNFSTFSLVNAVEPGTFDLGLMEGMETPGISLFMRVHELRDPLEIFDNMISVAQNLAQDLGGEIRDESRSVMTHQTIEHCRLGISEYLLKNRK